MDPTMMVSFSILVGSVLAGLICLFLFSAFVTSALLKMINFTGAKHKVVVILITLFEVAAVALFIYFNYLKGMIDSIQKFYGM